MRELQRSKKFTFCVKFYFLRQSGYRLSKLGNEPGRNKESVNKMENLNSANPLSSPETLRAELAWSEPQLVVTVRGAVFNKKNQAEAAGKITDSRVGFAKNLVVAPTAADLADIAEERDLNCEGWEALDNDEQLCCSCGEPSTMAVCPECLADARQEVENDDRANYE
jgi:hypothetical protein